MRLRKRLLLLGGIAGVAVGITVSLVALSGWRFLRDRTGVNDGWNAKALQANFSQLSISIGDEAVASFAYTIENKTPIDYSTDKSAELVLMKKLPSGKGVEMADSLNWDQRVYIPSGEKARVVFKVSYSYKDTYTSDDMKTDKTINSFFRKKLDDLDGFVIFDKARRYRIDFPNGWRVGQPLK